MEFTEKVLILRIGKFREADLWVRFLSPSKGIMSAFAFGGARSRRRFTGCLDVFNTVLLQVQSARRGGYNALQEGVLIQSPQRLRHDWRRLGLAMNCLKFIEAFGIVPDGADAAYMLFSQILAVLENDREPAVDLPLLFRARLAFEQGYALSLEVCQRCGIPLTEQLSCTFVAMDAAFYCCNCDTGGARAGAMGVRRETVFALAQMQCDAPENWRSGALAALSPLGRKECSRLIDVFIQHHVGLQWDTNRFMRI